MIVHIDTVNNGWPIHFMSEAETTVTVDGDVKSIVQHQSWSKTNVRIVNPCDERVETIVRRQIRR